MSVLRRPSGHRFVRLVAAGSACGLLAGVVGMTSAGGSAVVGTSAVVTSAAAAVSLTVADTTVEYLDNPVGIDTLRPRMSWMLEADGRDATQAAYQVQVATSADALAAGADLAWDSGRVPKHDSVNVEYGGEPLTSSTTYAWRVRVWADSATPSEWSEVGTFETGLLDAGDWEAQWIRPRVERAGGSYLRSSVTLPSDVAEARLYVSGRGNYERGPDGQGICCEQQFGLARGIYEAFVNGERVSDTEIESTMVDTRVRALYRTYDVTELVQAGVNVFGAMIGEDSDVLAQLRVTTTAGEVLDVGTDGTWTSAPGPVVRAHRYHGETYDARKEIAGWSTTTAGASAAWQPVRVASADPGRMESAVHEPMRVVRTHQPVAVTNPAPGVHVLDFGTNMTGWTRLSLDLPAGTTVTMKHGERLTNGRVDNAIIGAQQTNRYTAAGGGPVTWEPSFVYAGFRWVEVTGLPAAPPAGTIVAREVHNDVDASGSFSSDVDLLNRLHKANVQTQVNGLHAVPEDTPTREKRGWMADAHIAAEAVINNFDTAAFYNNWVEEMRAAQRPDGRVPDIVPAEPSGFWETGSDPAWAVAHVLIPAYLHERYADTGVLAEHYESLRDYLAYLETTTSGDLLTSPANTWGNDWLGIESTDSTLFRSGFYLWALREGAEAARLLDKSADAQQMEARADQVAAAVNARFLDEVKESYGSSQFANAFPLVLGIVPDRHVDGVVETLVRDVEVERDGHFTGGLPGIKYIPEALAMHGHSDLVLDVVTNTAYPGWGYMLDNGPGTIWEDWGGVSSLNHPMFTSIDNWLYDSVAGIDQVPGSTGYQQSVIAPQVTDQVRQGEASITTPYGTLSSAWQHSDGRLVQTVTVPVNTTSQITVPADSARAVLEGGGFAQDAAGVHVLKKTADGVVVTVGSGTYEFTTDPVLGQLGDAYDALAVLDARLDGPGVSATAARQLSRDVSRVQADVQAAIDARFDAASVATVREHAAAALGRLAVLENHIDGQEDDGQLTTAAAADLRRSVDQARGDLSRLVTRVDGVTVELQQVGDAIAGSNFEVRLVVQNGSDQRLTQLAALMAAPDGWTVRPVGDVPSSVAPGQTATATFGVTVPLTQQLGEVVMDGRLSAARSGTKLRVPVSLPVTVQSPITIGAVRAAPRVLETSDTGTDVTAAVTNRSQEVIDVTLAVEEAPDGWSATQPATVEIPAGASRTVTVRVHRTPDSAPGGDIAISVSSGGQEWARGRTSAFVRDEGCELDPAEEACLSADFTLLHNFEQDAEGWTADDYVATATSVPTMANSPGTARLGRRLLEAAAVSNTPANAWRTVSVTQPEPVPLGDANAFVVHVDAYGGAPSGPYQVRVVLRDSTGLTLGSTQDISPDAWNEVRVAFGDWAGQDVTSIDVSFRAAGGGNWPGSFQIDQVGLDAATPPPDPATNLAAGRPVTARASLNCCAWGSANLVDGTRASTPNSRGFTSDPPRTDPDNVEWVQVDLGQVRQVGSVWLWPRTATAGEPTGNGGAGFPDTFDIQFSDDGNTWTTRRSLTGEQSDGTRGVGYDVDGQGRYVRIHATKLGRPAPDEASRGFYRLQLAELEVYAATD